MATVKTRVCFSLEVACGPWGDDANMGQVLQIAKKEAMAAAEQVVSVASEKGIRLRIEGFGPGPVAVILPEEKK
jgi:hypothetical protein